MIGACAKAGVKLFVGYYRPALPRFLKVRDLIAEDAIGDVRLVRSQQFTRLSSTALDVARARVRVVSARRRSWRRCSSGLRQNRQTLCQLIDFTR
jgi:hypothetical protein